MTDEPIPADTSLREEVAAIQSGIDDMNAGRVRPLREIDQEFRAQRNIPADQ